MSGTVELEKSFDQLADLYERVRPGYPDSVFERILEFSALQASAAVLEVGAGTGKATVSLARRGLRILALEPGPNLVRVARARLAEFGCVDVQATSFEDWNGEPRSFDLAFVAQAFHWLAPDQRLTKFASVLRHSGTLAVFGNSAVISDGLVDERVQDVYARLAPALIERDGARRYTSPDSPYVLELQSSSLFTDVHHELFTWERSLLTQEYCALLATYSDHSTLPPDQLRELSMGVAAILDEHGGRVALSYKTGLLLARAVNEAS